jgi:hypothetical protein
MLHLDGKVQVDLERLRLMPHSAMSGVVEWPGWKHRQHRRVAGCRRAAVVSSDFFRVSILSAVRENGKALVGPALSSNQRNQENGSCR